MEKNKGKYFSGTTAFFGAPVPLSVGHILCLILYLIILECEEERQHDNTSPGCSLQHHCTSCSPVVTTRIDSHSNGVEFFSIIRSEN